MSCWLTPWAHFLKHSPLYNAEEGVYNMTFCLLRRGECNLSLCTYLMLKCRDCFPPPNSIQLSSPGLCFCQHFVQALALGAEVRSLLLCTLQEWNVTGWEGASIGLDSLDAASFLKDDFFDSTRKLCLFPNSKIWQGFRRQDKTDHARSVVFVYTSSRSLWIYKLVEKRGERRGKSISSACRRPALLRQTLMHSRGTTQPLLSYTSHT